MKAFPRILIFSVALGLVLFAGVQRSSAATPDSKQVTELLNDAKTHALQAEDDAATLQSYARTRVSWKLHTSGIGSMKQHVNEMGRIAAKLQELEPQSSEWQKQAIQQVMPLLREMAGNLSKTIQHLNENQSRIQMPPYQDYTRKNYELAKRTADLIRDFVDYDQAKSTAQLLEDKLELAKK